jgi:protein-tyrosine kinase
MGLVEQAAARLEELRRAGIEVPDDQPMPLRAVAQAAQAGQPRQATLEAQNWAGPQPNIAPERDGRANADVLNIDLFRLAENGFVTPDNPRSTIADEFRVIKRPLIANAKQNALVRNGNLIMVTSSVPGEGKTFCATNLALSMAMELNRTVLLVDADVAKASLPKVLGLPPTLGLMDVLQGRIGLADAIHRTNVEKLAFLSAGTRHPRATELLSSDAMGALVQELATRYSDRIVIFDSPPLLVTTEARVLATRMGQVIFVVHAETTLQNHVAQGLATLEDCPVKLAVLNAATTPAQGAYGYGYGYGSET